MSDAHKTLPDELLKSEQFCLWNIPGISKKKQPATWDGSKWDFGGWNKNPDKLVSCFKARQHAASNGVNVGLVVPDCWVIIDFDECRNPDTREIVPAVKDLIDRLNTIVCISSSGKGLHVFVRLRSNSELPKRSTLTNPTYSPGGKESQLKKPGTFVALSWIPLPDYSALDKQAQYLPDWLTPLLFPVESPALEPPRERTGETAVKTPTGTLDDDAARLRQTYFRGYTNGGTIWRYLKFEAEHTAPFMTQPEKISDRSQWIILIVRNYFQHVPDATNKDGIELASEYDLHWLKHFPYEHDRKSPHNTSWYEKTVLKERDYADHEKRKKKSDHPHAVVNACMQIIGWCTAPVTKNERTVLNGIAHQIQQQSDLAIQISNKNLATAVGLQPSVVAEVKNLLRSRNIQGLQITTASRPTTYRIVL